ncbi:hypothetical protein D3C81_989140 [compost metagenome]
MWKITIRLTVNFINCMYTQGIQQSRDKCTTRTIYRIQSNFKVRCFDRFLIYIFQCQYSINMFL